MALLESLLGVLLMGVCGLGGIVLVPFMKKYPAQYNIAAFVLVAFAAGALIGDALLHLIPEALLHFKAKSEEEEQQLQVLVGLFLFLGMWVFHIGNRFSSHSHELHPEGDLPLHSHKHGNGYMILVSDAIHNIFDGLAIRLAFQESNNAGASTLLAVAAHELPHEIADFAVLVEMGFSKWKALGLITATQLTSLIGVLIGEYASVNKLAVSLILSAVAGNFIYLALVVLLPMTSPNANQKSKKYVLLEQLGVWAGFLLMVGLVYIESHSHE